MIAAEVSGRTHVIASTQVAQSDRALVPFEASRTERAKKMYHREFRNTLRVPLSTKSTWAYEESQTVLHLSITRN